MPESIGLLSGTFGRFIEILPSTGRMSFLTIRVTEKTNGVLAWWEKPAYSPNLHVRFDEEDVETE